MSNTEIWLTVKQTSELMDIHFSTVLRNVEKYRNKKEKMNGGEAYMIALSSLPPDVQLKYYKQGSSVPAVIEKPEIVKESIQLTEYQITVAMQRAFVVQEFNKAMPVFCGGKRSKAKEEFMTRYKYEPYFNFARQTLGDIKLKTLERWRKLFYDAGDNFEALAPNYNYGGSKNLVNISEEEAKIIIRNLLHPNKLKMREVLRESLAEFKALGLPYSRSESTYFRFMDSWIKKNYDLYIASREGFKALNDKVLPYSERAENKIEVGDVFVIDGHVMNFTTINPLTGKEQRMIMVSVVDMKTLIPMGWEIMPTENTYAITSALRRAIKTLGFLPRAVYIDNGRANKSMHLLGKKRWFEGDLTETVGVFRALGIMVFIAKPYHGQSKVVERVFGIQAEYERRMISYTGISIEDKPARNLRNEKFHRELYRNFLKSAGITTAAPEIHEAMAMFALWIDEYANRKHRSGKQKGLSPYEVLDRSMAKVVNMPGHEKRLISDERLRVLMMAQVITKLYRLGVKVPRRGYYWSPKFHKYDKRKDRVKFLIRYDLLDADEILVSDAATGDFICSAHPRGEVNPIVKINGTDEEKQLLSSQLKETQALAKSTENDVRDIYGIAKTPSAEQTKKLIALHASDKAKKKIKPEVPRADDSAEADFTTAQALPAHDDDEADFSIKNEVA